MSRKQKIVFSIIIVLVIGIIGLLFNNPIHSSNHTTDNNKKKKVAKVEKVNFNSVDLEKLLSNKIKGPTYLTREETMILLSRVLTKDSVKIDNKGLNKDFYPLYLKENKAKETLAYFAFIFIDRDNLYNYTFGDKVDLSKKMTKGDLIPILFYSLDNEKSYYKINLLKSKIASDKDVRTYKFANEYKNLKQSGISSGFIEDFDFTEQNKPVSFKELTSLLKDLYNSSSRKVSNVKEVENGTLEFFDKNGKLKVDLSTINDPAKHNHFIANNPYEKDKHMLLHAVMYYEIKYKKLPIDKNLKPDYPKSFTDLLSSYNDMKLNDFVVLDVDKLYPEFLLKRYTKDIVVIEPKKHVMFFVNGYHDEKGNILH